MQSLVDALEQTARHLGDTSAKLYLTKPPAPPPMPPDEESPRDKAIAEWQDHRVVARQLEHEHRGHL